MWITGKRAVNTRRKRCQVKDNASGASIVHGEIHVRLFAEEESNVVLVHGLIAVAQCDTEDSVKLDKVRHHGRGQGWKKQRGPEVQKRIRDTLGLCFLEFGF